MRMLPGACVVALVLALPAPALSQTPQSTLTMRDIAALTEAGLSDEVLIAMIDADQSVFRLSASDVLALRRQGVSNAVLVRMIRTVPPPPLHRTTVEVDDVPRVADPVPDVRREPAPAPPIVVNPAPVVVQQTVVQEVRVEETRYVPVSVPVYVPIRPREPEKKPEPEYWGFGGKRRPDTWTESNNDVQSETKSTIKTEVKKPGGQ